MTTVEILRAARKLIERPDAWIQGKYARNQAGDPVNPNDPDACKFCGNGAIIRARGSVILRSAGFAAFALDRAIGASFIPWQDAPGRTHDEVLHAFDRAIALAEKEERT